MPWSREGRGLHHAAGTLKGLLYRMATSRTQKDDGMPERGLPSSWMVFRPLHASGSAAGLLVWFIISPDLQSVRPSKTNPYTYSCNPILAINSEPKEHVKTLWSGQTSLHLLRPQVFLSPRVSHKPQRHHKAQKVLLREYDFDSPWLLFGN